MSREASSWVGAFCVNHFLGYIEGALSTQRFCHFSLFVPHSVAMRASLRHPQRKSKLEMLINVFFTSSHHFDSSRAPLLPRPSRKPVIEVTESFSYFRASRLLDAWQAGMRDPRWTPRREEGSEANP